MPDDEHKKAASERVEQTRVMRDTAPEPGPANDDKTEIIKDKAPSVTERLEGVDAGAVDESATEMMDDSTWVVSQAGPEGTERLQTDRASKATAVHIRTRPETIAGGAGGSAGFALTVGSVLRNRFRITGTLGEGGMGAVFSAVDMLKEEARDENVDVALKVLKPDIVDESMSFMGLQREARRAQQLAHPNIVTVYDFDRADGVIYMTMEYLRGKPLDDLLHEKPHGLDLDQARDITTQICKGLAYAHKEGIVHADLKPPNVFVLDTGRVKILDFGIARAYQAKKLDMVESVFSGYSPAYASPEVMARKDPSPTDDVYALGCVVYMLFTGRHPFDSTPAVEAREQGLKPRRDGSFRRAEWAAVQAALSFDGSRRPQDAAEFLKRFAPSRMRKTALAISVASILAAVTFMFVYEPVAGPDIPFEELPLDLQHQINRNLDDAAMYLDYGDLDSAFQLYDVVLRAHPGNLLAMEGMGRAVSEAISLVKESVRSGATSVADGRQTLEFLLAYETLPARSRREMEKAINEL